MRARRQSAGAAGDSVASSIGESPKGTIVFPEVVRVLLDLLKSSHQLPLAIAVLSEFKRTLSPANMEALWEWPWLEWLDTFLQDRG